MRIVGFIGNTHAADRGGHQGGRPLARARTVLRRREDLCVGDHSDLHNLRTGTKVAQPSASPCSASQLETLNGPR
jgi:hypothetical protein